MAEAEKPKDRIITVNLRKELLKKPDWKRSKDFVHIFKALIKRQTKAEKIKMDKDLNKKIWRRGARKPPSKMRIKIVQIDDKSVRVELAK